MPSLLAIPFSPWSEKARWALDARHVRYSYRHYMPLLGEPMLRLKLRKWSGPVTVPVLIDDDGRTFADSADIARWADGRGEGPVLFPAAHERELARFVEMSERGLAAGRGLSLRRVEKDEEALGEMIPKNLRKPLGRLGVHVGAFGIRRTLRKYGASSVAVDAQERALVAVLEELRASLPSTPVPGEPKTLLGTFTFADVAMAQVLAFVEPPKFGLRIGPANRRSFGDPKLAARFADLVQWRDALYEKYRPRA